MTVDYLHNHKDFPDLIRIVAEEKSISPALVEKDYWIMHCLYGLQKLELAFELKGGTSLSKGYGIIDRFSEDIDIRIEPPKDMDVKTGRNQDKPAHCESRQKFYDWLASTIKIDGIESVTRDEEFDNDKYFSGGIRLQYQTHTENLPDLKAGILLEVGFDTVTPNSPKDISSWAYDHAVDKVKIKDNRAKSVPCYHAGYTLVEKLQAISTKYRKQQESEKFPENFMRHYYDVYCLLQDPEVLKFIGTEKYHKHKAARFPAADNQNILENPALSLSDKKTREDYKKVYQSTPSLYYKGQPDFDDILKMIKKYSEVL